LTLFNNPFRLLQPMIITSLLLHTFVVLELKRASVEAAARKYFPFIIGGLFSLQFVLAISKKARSQRCNLFLS